MFLYNAHELLISDPCIFSKGAGMHSFSIFSCLANEKSQPCSIYGLPDGGRRQAASHIKVSKRAQQSFSLDPSSSLFILKWQAAKKAPKKEGSDFRSLFKGTVKRWDFNRTVKETGADS